MNSQRRQSGQTLVALMAFMGIILTVTTVLAMVTIANAQSSSRYSLGQEALNAAESGVDNALLQLARDPNYTGETLTVNNNTIIISVSGATTKTVTAVGQVASFKRTIQATVVVQNATVNITAWSEVP